MTGVARRFLVAGVAEHELMAFASEPLGRREANAGVPPVIKVRRRVAVTAEV